MMFELGLGPNYDFGSRWTWNRLEKSDFNEFSFWVHEPLRIGKKKTCQSLESLNYDVRARIQAQITILVLDEHETDAKNQTLTNSAYGLTKPLEMVKKHVNLWNRAILIFGLGFRPKLRFLFYMSMKQTRKIGLERIPLLNSRTP